MKSQLSILLLFVCSLTSSAQKIRFSDHNNKWTTSSASIVNCPFNRTLHYGADTVITGKTYNHLLEQVVYLSTTGCTASAGSHDYYIREDTVAGIIYYRELILSTVTDTNEHVYFNYNLHAGDTIRFVTNAARDTVLEVDSTLINGIYHKVFIMASNGTMSNYTFVEGVGCMKYPYVNFMDGCYYAHEQLMCFSQSGVNPDMNFPVYQCYNTPATFHNISSCTALSVGNIYKPLPAIIITPNPAYDHIDITSDNYFDNNTTVSAYDMSGRCVLKTAASEQKNTLSINTASWSDGLYMVIVQNNSGIIKKEKVVVIK